LPRDNLLAIRHGCGLSARSNTAKASE